MAKKKKHPDELTIAYMLGVEKASDKINMLIRRNDNLEAMLKQIWYMARRYADGRCTVAPAIVNEVYDKCQKMGIDLGDDSGEKYASDGNLGKWMPDKQTFEGQS